MANSFRERRKPDKWLPVLVGLSDVLIGSQRDNATPMAGAGRYTRSCDMSNKEAGPGLQRIGEEAGDSTALEAGDEFGRFDSQQIPRHLASDHPHAQVTRE